MAKIVETLVGAYDERAILALQFCQTPLDITGVVRRAGCHSAVGTGFPAGINTKKIHFAYVVLICIQCTRSPRLDAMPESPEFIWPRLQAAGAKRRLSYDALVRAAAEIADRQGIEAVTMRSVATALNAGAMSLYRYVRGKDDLLDLILDAAFGEIELS